MRIPEIGNHAWVKWRTCDRKTGYESLSKANNYGKNHDMSAYECPYCSRWHLTKKQKKDITA